ncbi:MAG: hypothetical protein R3222_10845, partial [Balneolaceae bacterium]|nr:hypothetical protein [Balneolaceae bacterium]
PELPPHACTNSKDPKRILIGIYFTMVILVFKKLKGLIIREYLYDDSVNLKKCIIVDLILNVFTPFGLYRKFSPDLDAKSNRNWCYS